MPGHKKTAQRKKRAPRRVSPEEMKIDRVEPSPVLVVYDDAELKLLFTDRGSYGKIKRIMTAEGWELGKKID